MKKARTEGFQKSLRSILVLAAVAVAPALLALRSASAHEEDGAAEGAREAALRGDARPEQVWAGFVEHMKTGGHEDLFASGEEFPGLAKGDPIRGLLFRVSPDLVNLDALFTPEERERLDPAKRSEKARSLATRLAEGEDPYLADYGRYYAARLDLEEGSSRAAAETLEGLLGSHRFLDRKGVRQHLAKAYRGLGEDTLALLEAQFFLTTLEPEDASDQLWAEKMLEEIREKHDGPLHDCAARSKSIATLLSASDLGAGTQGEQRKVEDILVKVAKLLEEMARRCPDCNRLMAQVCEECKKAGKPCSSCSAKPCSTCGAGTGQKLAQAEGTPTGSDPSDTPAQDTKIEPGQPGEAHLRDDVASSRNEPWGEIHDREVARSLRESWAKIPPAYRDLVARYFKDITDLEPEEGK